MDIPPTRRRGFASDNYAGVHPTVLAAIAAANDGHAVAYGGDDETARFEGIVREVFGEDAVSFPVFNGTGANVVALQSITRSWEAVVCSDTAHVHADEGGAPERMAGIKLWTVPCADGKLTPALLEGQLFDRESVHRAQPGAVTIAQTTELGTLYTPEEVRALADCAHARGLLLHMDGARIANAAAALGVPFRAFTTDAGVDVLSLGGTKVGGLAAEAVVVLRARDGGGGTAAARALPFLRKTAMQLPSKLRFVSAQLCALYDPRAGVAVANAAHANAMAVRLARAVAGIPGVDLGDGPVRDPAANAVFPVLPAALTRALQRRFRFYVWSERTGQVRWMMAWDTAPGDVDAFAAAVREEAAALAAASGGM